MVTVFYGIPLTVLITCAWALAPVKQQLPRALVLLALLAGCGCFIAWWAAMGLGREATAAVAPAVLLAVMRLLLDTFSMVDARTGGRPRARRDRGLA